MAGKSSAERQTAPELTQRARRLRAIAGCFAEPALADTDRLIHERVRLGIMSALSVNAEMSFAALKELLQTSDGNLSRHARKLEDAGYIACRKTFADRLPMTRYSLTSKGRRAFARHLEHMDVLIQAARGE